MFNFPLTYLGAKILARSKTATGANVQLQEVLVVHNGTDAYITSYGTVNSPASNVGVFTATINTTAVSIKFQQTSANSDIKMFVQYIK